MMSVTYSDRNSAVDSMSSSASELSRRSRSRRFVSSKPSWLLLSISDMEDKIQAINGEDKPETFGERAEFYYQKRPQLISLLRDLYNRYLYLADRYTRTLSKQQQKQLEYEAHYQEHEEEKCVILDDNYVNHDYSDDAESSLSYQPPFQPEKPDPNELVISELVMKFVEYDIVVDELETANIIQEESKKKIELQRSLLEVLESERVVLTNENSRLASESLFMKRKAGELARCVLLERSEDHRVFVLGRKIDDLQGQIYELEKRNKEYYDKLVKQQHEEEKKNGKSININIKRLMLKSSASNSSLSWNGEEESSGSVSSTSNSSTCTSLAQVMKETKHPRGGGSGGTGKKISGWWDRVKKFDMFMCGQHLDSTSC